MPDAAAPSLSEADIARFTALVREAVGFDQARGDTVVVVNAAFRSLPEMAAEEEPKFWEKPVLRDTLKQLLGVALVLALAFGLVRPMLRNLVASHASAAVGYYGGDAAGGTVSLPGSGGSLPGGAVAIPPPAYEDKVAAAKSITGHDPARVAQVVRQWVATDD